MEEIISETQENPETELINDLNNKEDNNSDEQSSPRSVLEVSVLGSDSEQSIIISSISCESSETEKSAGDGGVSGEITTTATNHGLHWRKLIDHIKRKSVRRLKTSCGYELSSKSLRKRFGSNRSADDEIDCGEMMTMMPKPTWRNFSYDELMAATDNFNSEKLIGKGGHAEVYKGCLPDGQVVAVKKITKKNKNDEDRVGDFLSELGIIAHINHPNAAKLIGFSVDGGFHLVLQFLPHGSLASVLHGSTESLEWKVRFKVALGVAEGLQYLHCECQRRIIHRDITASNILLTEDYEPQISDFGLAKWLPDKWIHHVVSPIEGTFGYMAPEYFIHGIVDEKTDVFAFGVLLLELITGRRAVDSCRQSLVMWAKPLLEKNGVKEIADPRLGDAYDIGEMKRAILTASSCLHHLPSSRPNMNRKTEPPNKTKSMDPIMCRGSLTDFVSCSVVQLLRGEDGVVDVKQKSMGGRALLLDVCDLEDYTCTTYLNDLNRHMQLVME